MSEGRDTLETAAVGFVESAGTPLDRVRAAVTLNEAQSEALLASLETFQRADGAFCFSDVVAGDPVAGAAHALAILHSAGLLSSATAERAAGWLAGAQEGDGAWTLAQRGEHARHLAIGFLAGFLAQTPFARASLLEAAGDWLAARWSPELVRGGDFAMLAAYAAFFANSPHEQADPILQWCGRELERGVRAGHFPALFALRVLALCDAPVFPGCRLPAGALRESLAADQARDGGWFPSLSARWRVAATLVALEVWRRFPAAKPFAAGR